MVAGKMTKATLVYLIFVIGWLFLCFFVMAGGEGGEEGITVFLLTSIVTAPVGVAWGYFICAGSWPANWWSWCGTRTVGVCCLGSRN